MEVSTPSFKSGKIKVVSDQWVENWIGQCQEAHGEHPHRHGKKFDAWSPQRRHALARLEAMKTAGLAGKVPISGQDATEAGCNSIARGESPSRSEGHPQADPARQRARGQARKGREEPWPLRLQARELP